nr:hypothetical protein GCM10010200_095820 [Actinomadura rugatobispora]
MWVDCYAWPLRTARVPSDARVLMERGDHPIPHLAGLVNRHRATPSKGGESIWRAVIRPDLADAVQTTAHLVEMAEAVARSTP